ncbi:MAG: HAMP domain-containing histidine kinase [Holophagae bacterium]|nr:HAMP domain-containing histidine kinase [Holophagae bacterium]
MYTGEPIHGSGDMRRLFDAFSEMKEQVRQTVADKERLLRDVSHDLKSPITRMRVAAEMLPESPIRQRILKDLGELQGLVNQVLDVQRRKDFKRELVEVESFLREFLVTHELGFPVQMNIRETFSIRGNGEQLSRVLENLLDNSAKYADVKKGVSISCYIEGKDGVIDFSDSGNGVSQDVIARIFNPFFKGDESRRQDVQNGSGLGLAICRTIVEAMDGSIHAAASESGGLLLHMRFPREEEGAEGR